MKDVKGVKWNDSESERETVQQDFHMVQTFAADNKVPVHIGEFGAYSAADIDSRARWTTYLARWFEEQGFSWAYWEFSAGFGIYDPVGKTYLTPLVNALLHNPMPEPATTEVSSVYESNFQNNTDGWVLQTQSNTTATQSIANNKLLTEVSTAGTDGWHIQLVKNDIPLEKNQLYRFSFKASSTKPYEVTNYIGRNADPWDAYSGYNQASVTAEETTFTYVFTMNGSGDPAARLAFDLGTISVSATLSLSDIKLEKLQINPVGTEKAAKAEAITHYFSPDQSHLYLLNNKAFTRASVYSLSGSLITKAPLTQELNELNSSQWPSGAYLLLLESKNSKQSLKIWKK
ncbi:hypothetical protein M2459_003250 [Parabacteroides sp. PF5-5]|nr:MULTISPECIES: carbohydrate binding domain-containing protein [unclassified Parabacteroides]MDH6306494.1 hypothetical protein [Parabacteroides sp. PH5-39]MDH6317461.1 hypothetical protein [Parabacteroides sp. PF5-13]MDH6321236.1 hypothetical protein [Parabacteroides sp. PH5-13]MDH6324968.1 hypothetical protein [Parabacteroides sp. PH5-8]MDH6328677.1 hypothetical protein [Parabacteroides sp. PH5-41]